MIIATALFIAVAACFLLEREKQPIALYVVVLSGVPAAAIELASRAPTYLPLVTR